MNEAYYIAYANIELAHDLAKASRITLYGLRYTVNWMALFNKYSILKALELDDFFDILTDDQRQCLVSKLMGAGNSFSAGCGCGI